MTLDTAVDMSTDGGLTALLYDVGELVAQKPLPGTVFGVVLTGREMMSLPVVNALAPISGAMSLSACTRTDEKSAPNADSIGARTLSSSLEPWPEARRIRPAKSTLNSPPAGPASARAVAAW